MAKVDARLTTFKARQIERTFRFEGTVPRDGAPSVNIFREKYWQTNDGDVIGQPVVTTYQVNWSAIAEKSWTLSDGTSITAQQIFEGLAAAFDELAVPPTPPSDEEAVDGTV